MSVLKYSAISAKIHSMSGKLMNNTDYDTLINLSSVDEFASFLRSKPEYIEGINLFGTMKLNRDKLEKVFTYSLLQDFTRLYNFASLSQKKLLIFFLLQYEAEIIKTFLRSFYLGSECTDEIIIYESFIKSFTKLDIKAIKEASSMEEFVGACKDSEYYPILKQLQSLPSVSLYDYESQIDLHYLSRIWAIGNKTLRGNELEIFRENYGTQIDLMNINWIYRAKKYYNMSPIDIIKVILPIGYRLHRHTLKELIEAPDLTAYEELLKTTYYIRRSNKLLDLDKLYANVVEKSQKNNKKRSPYSSATMNYYIYRKNQEIHNLTVILECIRYNLDINTRRSYLQGA